MLHSRVVRSRVAWTSISKTTASQWSILATCRTAFLRVASLRITILRMAIHRMAFLRSISPSPRMTSLTMATLSLIMITLVMASARLAPTGWVRGLAQSRIEFPRQTSVVDSAHGLALTDIDTDSMSLSNLLFQIWDSMFPKSRHLASGLTTKTAKTAECRNLLSIGLPVHMYRRLRPQSTMGSTRTRARTTQDVSDWWMMQGLETNTVLLPLINARKSNKICTVLSNRL